jgi:hypothetical protein
VRGEHQAEADLHREAIGDRDEHTGPQLETPTIRVPMRFQRRGGRKLILTPEGATSPPRKPARDETLIKSLIRAHTVGGAGSRAAARSRSPTSRSRKA